MEFKKDRITLSFDKFREYLHNLNIDINIELLNLLCHKDYVVANDKNGYICKLKYSEERIKKAKTERLKVKSKKIDELIDVDKSIKDLSKEKDNKELHIEDLNVNKKDLEEKDEICESPVEECVKDDNKIFKQNIQTAKTSSYLFYENPIDIETTKYIDNDIIDKVPDNILDIYEELDLKDQIIDNLENDLEKLRKEIFIRDKKINELIKEMDILKTKDCTINKKDLINYFDNILLKQSKLCNYINNFILDIEETSPKKIKFVTNKGLPKLKSHILEINSEVETLNKKICELLNY